MFVQLVSVLILVPILAEMETITNISSTDFPLVNKSLNINDTVDTNASGTKASFLLYDYLIPTIGSLIILLNLVVVISSGLILKKGQQPRSTYLFLGNVAMTDLVTGVAVVFGQVYPKDKRDHYLCAVQLGLIVSSTLTSVYSVGLIAVDRFLYILHGMQYQRWVYPTRARLLICVSWAIGLFVGFLPLMGWYGDTNNGRICWFIILAPKGLVLLTVLVGIVPLLVVIFLYSIILYHAIKKIIQLQQQTRNRNNTNIQEDISSGNIRMFRGGGNTSENEEQPQVKEKGILRFFKKKPSSSVKSPNKWKAIKVVLFTTGSFVLTWCPYFITSLIYVFNCDIDNTSKKCKTMRTLIASPLAILGFMNSFLNPVIYAWWHKGFRTFFKKKVNNLVMRSTHTDVADNSTSKSTSSKNISDDSDKNKTSRNKSNLDAS
ncbi:glucose-dependent insulinotropic receptor-like [Anoplophora glabripennis]|uniref:glucose-dependent insulinotropic receptor-like n=1 Tax=Anoplophora glabripennis TaxID=217634 RepID=UPI000874CDBB|nr:glucose-dependent insulinotropic receptor-like [Anoplophora glabripennis]